MLQLRGAVRLGALSSRQVLSTPRTLSSSASTSSVPNAPASTSTNEDGVTDSPTASTSTSQPSPSFFKITLLRSAIGLGERKKATLTTLGIHRRMQTVYHPHSPEFAGKILAVKELVRVENVPAAAVRTKEEQRRERKASKGFEVLRGLKDAGLEAEA